MGGSSASSRPATSGQRVLFLDRDGVINEKAAPGDYITTWDDFRFCDGISGLLKLASDLGYKIVVITNQQCVGKGLLSRRELEQLHDRMIGELAGVGARIDGVHYCPHLEAEQCDCRKPRPGLLHDAMRELGGEVDVEGSFFVGDSATDVMAGRAAGLRTILLSGKTLTERAHGADFVVESLRDIASLL